MALNDILPFTSPMGGHCRIEEYPLGAGTQSFVKGEVVYIDAAGDVSECGDDPDDPVFSGVSATGGDETAGPGTLNFETGIIITAGDMVKVYIPDFTQRWITRNFATGGAGVLATPVQADVGLVAGFSRPAGQWSLDTGATNSHARIVQLLDADGADVARSGGTAVFTIFTILRGLMQSPTIPVVSGA